MFIMYNENLTLLILPVKHSNNNGRVLNIRVLYISKTTSVYTKTMVNNTKHGSIARRKNKYIIHKPRVKDDQDVRRNRQRIT